MNTTSNVKQKPFTFFRPQNGGLKLLLFFLLLFFFKYYDPFPFLINSSCFHFCWLVQEISLSGGRYQNCLREIRSRASDVEDKENGIKIEEKDWEKLHLHIASYNNFPTAAGLASSAAGFACLGKQSNRPIFLSYLCSFLVIYQKIRPLSLCSHRSHPCNFTNDN